MATVACALQSARHFMLWKLALQLLDGKLEDLPDRAIYMDAMFFGVYLRDRTVVSIIIALGGDEADAA